MTSPFPANPRAFACGYALAWLALTALCALAWVAVGYAAWWVL